MAMPDLPLAAPAPLTALIDDDHPPRPELARELIDDCAGRFVALLAESARGAIEGTDDLFEAFPETPEADVHRFRQHRGEWQERFERTLSELVRRRLGGTRRKGRRPDTDVSAATLRVLSAFDQERQTAIIRAAAALTAAARRETAALDRRVGLLLAERSVAEVDNPFGVPYVLDAIGASSRAIYPSPRIWRPLMERLLEDLKPAIVKAFITLNRQLADRGVLPEVKAALRARSDLRPADDSELLPLFEKMLKEATPPAAAAAIDVAVPTVDELKTDAPALRFAEKHEPRPEPPAPGAIAGAPATAAVPIGVARALYAAYARYVEREGALADATPAAPAGDDFAFPQVDSMLALGDAGAMIAELDHWQRFDAEREFVAPAPEQADAAVARLPLNRIPFIRQALGAKIANPADAMTMDVVALIFDYIFRDPSIPDAQRRLFARLQVPIAKAALLDRSFFTQRNHPARRLLDDLATAAIGAQGDADYRREFEALAQSVVDRICADFGIDLAVFESADARIRPFVEHEHAAAGAGGGHRHRHRARRRGVRRRSRDGALAAARPAGRTRGPVRDPQLRRDALGRPPRGDPRDRRHRQRVVAHGAGDAGRPPVEHRRQGAQCPEGEAHADDSLAGPPPAGRRHRPRRGRRARRRLFRVALPLAHRRVAPARDQTGAGPDCRDEPPRRRRRPRPLRRSRPPWRRRPALRARRRSTRARSTTSSPRLAIGTWINFRDGDSEVPARLLWVSPLRTRYIFTTRGRGRALAFTPEELCVAPWRRAGDADRRTGAVVRPRGQRRAGHPRGTGCRPRVGRADAPCRSSRSPTPASPTAASRSSTTPTSSSTAGNAVGLIGRNGCGKSSLLRVLAGRGELDDGEAWRAPGLSVAHVAQEPALDPDASVYDTVAQGLGAAGLLLADFHHATARLAANADDTAALAEVDRLHAELDATGGWTLGHRVDNVLSRLALDRRPAGRHAVGRLAEARRAGAGAGDRARPAAARRADQPPRPRRDRAGSRTLLRGFPGAVVFVTHDRRFLDRVATRIVELDRGRLQSFPGSFAAYRERKAEELADEAVVNAQVRQAARAGRGVDPQGRRGAAHAQRGPRAPARRAAARARGAARAHRARRRCSSTPASERPDGRRARRA